MTTALQQAAIAVHQLGQLAPIAELHQFIGVKLVPLPDGKTDKLPLTPQGHVTPKGAPGDPNSGAHNPAYWLSWADAHALATRLGHGYAVGFVITKDCGFVCLDIDGCIKPEDRSYTQIVHDLTAQLGAHVVWELSQSGKGLHLWMRGTPPPHGCKDTALGIELYSERRFICLGQPFSGDMDAPCAGLAAVATRYFPPKASSAEVNWGEDYRHPDWEGPPLSDEDVVRVCERSMSSAQKLGAKATMAQLMEGDPATLVEYFVDKDGCFDESSADMALFNRLVWGCGHNAAQTVRIARTSGLVREKWEREGYIRNTLARAMTGQGCYTAKPSVVDARHTAEAVVVEQAQKHGFAAPAVTVIAGTDSYATREQQIKLFAGCVLIADNDGDGPVVLLPSGARMKRPSFESKFAGPDYLLGGPRNKSTDSAWEAFHKNKDMLHPRVDRPAFRPMDPFQSIYADRYGGTSVNTYLPRGEFKEGDPAPFVAHIGKILPKEDDALILTSYLAACVQNPGLKFTWAVVLVSAAEGAGKGQIGRVMATALGREYVKQPKAATLLKDFNLWMQDALFVMVNDMPASAPEALLEVLKPMITDGEGASVEGKGTNQISADVFCNWMFTSNHKDGIRKTANDRRFCMLFCAQDDADDLERDGMGEAYFARFNTWLKKEDGRAIAANYLKNFPIPERFDPTKGAVRAPATSSTAEALQAGRDELTQILLDNVADGSPGFRGDWASQTYLAHYSTTMRVRPRPQQLKSTLESQGYVKCPGLPDGRTNNTVRPDNAKATLWIRKGSKTLHSVHKKTAAEIARMYEAAQAVEAPATVPASAGMPNFLGNAGYAGTRPAFGLP